MPTEIDVVAKRRHFGSRFMPCAEFEVLRRAAVAKPQRGSIHRARTVRLPAGRPVQATAGDRRASTAVGIVSGTDPSRGAHRAR